MKLTGREKSELFFEGVVTVILLLLLNLSIVVLINSTIAHNPGLQSGIFQIKRSITIGPNNYQLWSYENIFIGLMLIADGFVLYWRLIRRYKQMQLRHIISELHYIAAGHFDHRIDFNLTGDTQRVVESVNALVDSAIHSMDEEREIERSKDALITNVSHDIRTPLTSIIGYLGLIENQQYQSEEDLVKYAHIAYLKASQMKSLVEDLFEYTKSRQTETPLAINRLNLTAMLEQLAASFELEANKKHLKIEVESGSQPIYIEADAEKLGRVFSNLITNAFKYGTGAKNVVLQAEQRGEEVVIHVTNDGQRIPAESLSRLFERFYRVEESRSKATGGSGLGLAIAQSIVEHHGGYIYAQSDDEQTSFVIHLPVKHDQPLTKKQSNMIN